MGDRGVLRAQALERDQGCVWPDDFHDGPLEMAHLEPSGMGGRGSVDVLANVRTLCRRHHGLLDGRDHAGLKRALVALLKAGSR